jgi:hypothetical protein
MATSHDLNATRRHPARMKDGYGRDAHQQAAQRTRSHGLTVAGRPVQVLRSLAGKAHSCPS